MNNLKLQMEERKAYERQMKSNMRQTDKDAIDKEVIAFQQSEADRQVQERNKKLQYYNQLKSSDASLVRGQTTSQPSIQPEEVPRQAQFATRDNQNYGNQSRISNNPLAMGDIPEVGGTKAQVLAQRKLKNDHMGSAGTGDLSNLGNPREAYQSIKKKNGNAGSLNYNILTGM